jgi:TRAP-type C4-dicarboxylate transport system permease small subunit
MLGKVLETSCNGLRVLLGCLVGALIIPVMMQVIARYTGIIPVYLWTEELSTFIFIWVVMIGSMIAVWDGLHFDVQVIPEANNRYIRLAQKALVFGCIAFFGLYFAWYGREYLEFGLKQHSVMMRANLAWTHISVPISGAVWAIFALYRLFETFVEFANSKSSNTQEISS